MAEKSFEKNLKRLEEIAAKLEGEEVSLEESMKLFEEGVKLSRVCSEKLDNAERKVEILLKDREGKFRSEAFSPDES